MDFAAYISTPANTLEADPLVTSIKLTRGRLTGGFLYFPSGPSGTLHVIARIGIHQLAPFNTGQNFCLDDCVIPLSLGIDILEPPFEVDVLTWNTSTLYSHACTISFALEPRGRTPSDLLTLINEYAATEGYHKP